MKIRDAISAYSDLSNDQKRFIQTKQIEVNTSPINILAFMKPIVKFDLLLVDVKAQLKFACITSVILSILGGFGLGVVLDKANYIFWGMLAAFLFGVTTWIISTYIKRHDLDDNLWHFVVPFINVLRLDLDEDKPMYLKLDFTTHETSLYHQKTVKNDPGILRYPKSTLNIYLHKWLEFSCKLVNGISLYGDVNAKLNVNKSSKRSRSDKIKTKVKRKIKHYISFTADLSRKKIEISDAFKSNKNLKVKVKESDRKQRVIFTSSVNGIGEEGNLDSSSAFTLLGSFFKNISPVKKGN